MKSHLITAAVLLGLISILGWSKVHSHGKAIVSEVREEINRLSPGEHEAERIRKLLDERDRQLLKQHVKVDSLERKAEKASEEAVEIGDEIEVEKSILERASSLLASDGEEFTIGGRTYSRSQVERDARAHLSSLANLRIRLENRQVIADDLMDAVAKQRTQIAGAERGVQEARVDLETLDLRLESAELQAIARSLTDDLRREGVGGYDELSDSLESYISRVEEAEILAGVRTGSHLEGDLVDWSGSGAADASGSGDILALIDGALGRGPKLVAGTPSSLGAKGPTGTTGPTGPTGKGAQPPVTKLPTIDSQFPEPDPALPQAASGPAGLK